MLCAKLSLSTWITSLLFNCGWRTCNNFNKGGFYFPVKAISFLEPHVERGIRYTKKGAEIPISSLLTFYYSPTILYISGFLLTEISIQQALETRTVSCFVMRLQTRSCCKSMFHLFICYKVRYSHRFSTKNLFPQVLYYINCSDVHHTKLRRYINLLHSLSVVVYPLLYKMTCCHSYFSLPSDT